VLVSALSESLDRISIAAARKVFVDGFLANRVAWRVRIPDVPLEELYGGRLMSWLEQHGVRVRMLNAVERLHSDGERISGVVLKSGEVISGDEFVVAVPFQRVKSLLPESLATDPLLAGIERLESAPISSVHLWFDRPVMDLPHAVFVQGLCQWVFRRTPTYYQVVISASRDVVQRDSAEVLRQVLDELAGVFPAVKSATLTHSRQVTEHRAVFSPLPGSDALRPPQQSPIRNLQFAGDWTRTGWPATMEGAVRSGYLAAENILRNLGREEQIVQPDLPRAWLFRALFAGNTVEDQRL
jgi:squalene-associated FAD-dependent desaturase